MDCAFCNKSYTRDTNLKKHLLSCHKDETTIENEINKINNIKPFICNNCNSSFKRLSTLKRHKSKCESLFENVMNLIKSNVFTNEELKKINQATNTNGISNVDRMVNISGSDQNISVNQKNT